MVNRKIEDLIDILGETYFNIENSFVSQNNKQLLKGMGSNISNWKLFHESNFDIYKKVLIKMSGDVIGQTQRQIEKIYLLSYKTISPESVVVTKSEIYGKDLPKSLINKIEKDKNAVADEINKLASSAFSSYKYTVKLVKPSMNADKIYETIRKQMDKGIEKGLAVNYRVKSGKYAGQIRKVPFKSYMEMNSRTNISNEIGKQQISAGAKTGLIFYMCDSFADCAKDHQNYQGKIYYNEKSQLPEEARKYIQKHNIMSMQKAMDAPIYLTTRPNCRHGFHSLSTKKVLENDIAGYSKIFTHGKFDSNNYKLTQEQRANERLIRKYKMMKENYNDIYKTTNDEKDRNKYLFYKNLENKWTRVNNLLIQSNKRVLKRNEWREDARIIVDDLGVKYDLGIA